MSVMQVEYEIKSGQDQSILGILSLQFSIEFSYKGDSDWFFLEIKAY
jgi:hypothetical protein